VNHYLIDNEDRRLSMNLGLTYTSTMYATDANNVELPDYFQLDTGLQYEMNGWRLRLNIYNLLDQEAFKAGPNSNVGIAGEPIYALPVAPISFRLSVSRDF